MRRVLLQRLVVLPFLLLGVAALAFLLIRLTPGDPARALAGGIQASPTQIDAVRAEYGLDASLPVQFTTYIGNLLQGNLGESFTFKTSVASVLGDRFPVTIELASAALLIGVPLGLLLGMAAARRRDSWIDQTTTLLSITALALPLFWLGFMLAWLFSVQLGWLPLGGRLPPFTELHRITGINTIDATLQGEWGTLGEALRHLVLPACTLAILPMALTARFARASFIEVLEQDYIRTARAYGVPEREVVWRHAAKNALLPLITLLGVLVPTMLVASLLAEVVFSWQGVGVLLLEAVNGRDYAVVQGLTLILGLLFVVSNLIVDVSYTFLDPRTRRS